MVYVRLERNWTDSQGNTHEAGAMVDLDAGTLAELEANGTVVEPVGASWGEPTGGGEAKPNDAGWAGPTGGGEAKPNDAGWAGPTGGGGSGS